MKNLLVMVLVGVGVGVGVLSGPTPPSSSSSSPSPSPSSFGDSFSVVLDQEGSYVLNWKPLKTHIEFEVQVRTRGYVGLGFSPNGGMKGADIIIAWVKEGQVYLHDRHSTGYSVPTIDPTQNVEVIRGYENDTHTVITFKRPWDTCDSLHDYKLGSDTVRVIWAYGYDDPINNNNNNNNDNNNNNNINIHNKRGTKSLYLTEASFAMPLEFTSPSSSPSSSSDIQTWDVLISNVSLPENVDTVYWCKLFKFPAQVKKAHIIGHVPILTHTNSEYVHHLVLYECHLPQQQQDHNNNNTDDSSSSSPQHDHLTDFNRWATADSMGHSCRSATMPPSWKMCANPIVAWAVGSEGEMLPDHVGFPVEGGEGGGEASFFMMEVHYDNPNLNTDVIDTSGIRVFYTERLREFDAGTMFVGESVSPHLIIPPSSTFHTTAYCPGSCTAQTLPPGGLHIFQGLLHSHLLGTSLSLRQVREGVELPPVLQDKNYDFNFQQGRILKNEITVLPGDSLITQCVFRSERKEPAFGGLRTQDEMCLAFLSYYPKINMAGCMSHQPTSNLLKAIGIEEVFEEVDLMKMIFDEHTQVTNTSEWNNKNKEGKKKKKEEEEEEEEGEKKNEGVRAMKEMLWLLKAKSPQRYANKTLYQILHDPNTWDEKDEDGVGLAGRMQVLAKEGLQVSYCLGEKTYKKNTMVWSGKMPSFTPYEAPASESLCQHNSNSVAVETEISIN